MYSYELSTKHEERLLNKKYPGSWIFWGIAVMAIPLWMISFPETTVRHNLKPFFVYLSQIFALVGFALFALTLILSSRSRFLEDRFGGLDKMYKTHRAMGKTAVLFLIIHPVLLALRWIPEDIPKAFWYLLPLHRRVEIDLGSWALWGILMLTILTVVVKIPYDKWKLTHKLMGFFFILGVVHFYFQGISFSENPALKIYLALLSAAGIIAWLYKSVFYDLLKKKSSFLVTNVERFPNNTVEIELRPQKKPEKFLAGQFYFFSFLSRDLPPENHPFTICHEAEDGKLKIMVKSLGDYTSALFESIEPGIPAILEGPYGRFYYRNANPNQIWIAGGVGVAPFLSWANQLLQEPDQDLNVDFYYCVKNISAATYLETFRDLEEKMPGFHAHLICEETHGYFKVSNCSGIQEKEIFICGPGNMRKAILKDLKDLNVPQRQIHFEEFDFN